MAPVNPNSELLTRQQAAVSDLKTREWAAEFLGLKTQTLSVWACTGRYGLPFVRVGRCVRYKLSDLEKFISDRTVGTVDDGAAEAE